MMRIRKLPISVLAALAATPLPSPVHADWEGKISVKAHNWIKNLPGTLTGTMQMRDDKTRIDFSVPAKVTTLIHGKKGKTWSLVHDFGMYYEGEISPEGGGQAALCGTQNIDACYRKRGLKKVATETFAGQRCAVYKGDMQSAGTPMVVKIWRPTSQALREVPAIRTVIYHPGGGTLETEVTDIQPKKLSDRDFAIPAGYGPAGNVMEVIRKAREGMRKPGS